MCVWSKCIGRDCRCRHAANFLLSAQWRKPSSGSLTTDSDTGGGWLAVPHTPGGDHQSGWEAQQTDRCLMGDDTKYAVVWPRDWSSTQPASLVKWHERRRPPFHLLMRWSYVAGRYMCAFCISHTVSSEKYPSVVAWRLMELMRVKFTLQEELFSPGATLLWVSWLLNTLCCKQG